MKRRKERRFKWHIAFICVVLTVVVLLTVFTDTAKTSGIDAVSPLIWFFGVSILLVTVLLILSKASKIGDELSEIDKKFEKFTTSIEKNREVLSQISQNTRLSETAKAIASRNVDRQALQEVVFDKLQQNDFDTAYEIVDEISQSTIYQELAKQLHDEVDKFRDASQAERINQIIAHIERLLDNCNWAKASLQIERLIKATPDSEEAKAMRQKLVDKKEERKKILLTSWDDAVKRQATDRSLEILRELDLYLTPNEGLALQEAARDIFRSKLHSLGVQFSLAVSGKQWSQALETGQQIIRDFPNSRMAEEIREKMDILKQKVQQQ